MKLFHIIASTQGARLFSKMAKAFGFAAVLASLPMSCPRHPASANFAGGFRSRCGDGDTGRHLCPTVAAITLGLVSQEALLPRLARNVIWDRMGNIFIAAVAGAVGWWWTQRAIFFLVPVFTVASTAAIMSIPGRRIDHRRARAGEFASGKPLGFSRLVSTNRSLLTLG